MGKLTFETTTTADLHDRRLVPLQLDRTTRLRRGYGCHFTWRAEVGIDNGRTIVWRGPTSGPIFKFEVPRRPAPNPARVDASADTANSLTARHVLPARSRPLPQATKPARSTRDGQVTRRLRLVPEGLNAASRLGSSLSLVMRKGRVI